ncbi:hypothetical protein [Halomonas sp. H10-9-1]|uniref:hypothetical protein n=1 Tax=Halomonas sp. H10-9-1 TaxID=2950871 RepID=UPI0032DF1DE3
MEEIPEMSKVAGFMWALQSGIPLRQRSQYHVPRIEMSTYPYDIEEVYACFDDGVSYYENAKLKDPWMFEKVFGEELHVTYD